MPGKQIEPNEPGTFDSNQTRTVILPPGKRATISIKIGSPLWENAGSVFDLDSNNRLVAHANIQAHSGQYDPVGPFQSSHRLLVAALHKDIDWGGAGYPWHQSFVTVYREKPDEYWFGFNDAGIPSGDFDSCHVRIRIEIE